MSALSPRDDLDDLLTRAAREAFQDMRYVEGGYVERTTTVPIEQGVGAVVKFARSCWEANLELQKRAMARDRKLELAEQALRELTERVPLTREIAVALAAVQAARELW